MARRDPLLLVYEALKVATRAGVAFDILVKADYPAPVFFKAKLPAVGLLKIGGTGVDRVTPGDIHEMFPPNPDGTMTVACEYRRYSYLLQLSVFACSKRERSDLGQAIEEYLQKNRYLPLPGDALRDHTLVIMQGPHTDAPGETGFYQRDYTLECTGRLLIAQDFNLTEEIIVNNQVK